MTAVSGSTPSVSTSANCSTHPQDVVEFGDHRRDFGIAHGDARELGDMADLFGVYGHGPRDSGGPCGGQAALRAATAPQVIEPTCWPSRRTSHTGQSSLSAASRIAWLSLAASTSFFLMTSPPGLVSLSFDSVSWAPPDRQTAARQSRAQRYLSMPALRRPPNHCL